MEQINLDSDCEVEEPNTTTITINDSQDEESMLVEDGGEIEDGELSDDDGDLEVVNVTTNIIDITSSSVQDDSLIVAGPQVAEPAEALSTTSQTNCQIDHLFEVVFPRKSVFDQIGQEVLKALYLQLNGEGKQKINIVVEPPGAGEEGCMILRAFAEEETDNADEDDGSSAEVATCGPHPDAAAVVNQKEGSPDLSGISDLFMIDTEPAAKLETIKVPSYKRVIKDVLDEESLKSKRKKKEEDVDKCQRPRPAAACFNCGENGHSLRECPKPRNNTRINKAKKAFTSKNERYHIDIEQRFAHLRPGVISEALKSAMGLRKGEIPFFFYRMRVLGYPPGWLEEAKVADSGIALFNSDGSEVLKPDEDEGEIDSTKHKFNISKIIEFPGFNASPGNNFYDDYKHHNVPAMSQMQTKDDFIKTLGDNVLKGYKRKKLKDLPRVGVAADVNMESNSTSTEVADMEIEDADMTTQGDVLFTRPMPPPDPLNNSNDIAQPPPPPPPGSPPPATNSSPRTASPSLADLEAQQLKLLQELKTNVSLVSMDGEDSLIDEVIALENEAEALESQESRSPLNNTPSTDAQSSPSTPLETEAKLAIFKDTLMGTPLLKFSPFDKLPAGDNFKVGVSDVINFENLPDSTGKYEQMKGVIKKVRTMITKLHNEDEDN